MISSVEGSTPDLIVRTHQSLCHTEEISKNISVRYDSRFPFFIARVKADIELLKKSPVGARLIQKIGECATTILILYNPEHDGCGLIKSPDSIFSLVLVSYSASRSVSLVSGDCKPLNDPPFIFLAHELIHGYHHARGKAATSHLCDKLVWTNDEDYHTIMGFPSKKQNRSPPKITENAI
ncbi:MAG: hypothetical protein JSR46_10065, partial [Verrucomicrobia bacterium]|nr:hypothetical protein [Verrucomicrobiota bacterium]